MPLNYQIITDVQAFLALIRTYTGGLLTVATAYTAKRGRIKDIEVTELGRIRIEVKYKWKMACMTKHGQGWPIPEMWVKTGKRSGSRVIENIADYEVAIVPNEKIVITKPGTLFYGLVLRPATANQDPLSGF